MTAPELTFPVDDLTLELLEQSLLGAYREDATGQLVWHGAAFTLTVLLELLSGYDKALAVPDDHLAPTHLDIPVPVHTQHYPGHLFSTWDALLALIAEVRRLRTAAR